MDIALSGRQEALAKTLIEHKADVDKADADGETLLHRAILRGSHINISDPA